MQHQDRNPRERKSMRTSPINSDSPAHHEKMSAASGGRKRQRAVGFRIPRKAFRLCVRDEYGTRALNDPTVVLRPTPL
ncbi:hypothetical protein PVAP13_7KG228210 [Panicum virgatum]|uniref:Uncharacterized protein n=1 Tax=Panicum virgatum TaxID=38727 RepID=A0A8T0QNK3_PANVG|nr:hypothetical protein PVAP13_7KG228210 [Panicum virgatum]